MKLIGDKNLARLNRAVASGRIIPYLIALMFLIMFLGAVAVRVLSPHSFSSFGNALWWSATTVTTIGYGDVVPATSGGRVVAVFVMFASVATVSFTTAVVTATFVGYHQRRLGHETERHRELLESLDRIEKKIEALDVGPSG
jgi:voltage-gated potassium channel